MKLANQLDRKDLLVAVWAAEFTRALGGASAAHDGPILLKIAEEAARNADRAVEALRLVVDVEFRLASPDELDDSYMTWEKFVAGCQSGALTDYDGHGELATDDRHVSNLHVSPGDALCTNYPRPTWATHVCWYNR